jgi:hypothetical protein
MKFEVILGRIFISLVSLLVAFGLVDFISIRLLPTRAPVEQRFPVEVFRKPQPYTMFGGTPNADFEYEDEQGLRQAEKLNGLGYRGPAPASPKPAGEYRVFMLGGSTVFLGEPPIPALLEEEFKRHNLPQVKVYNFGVISSVSGMELARIVFEVSELEPDLIVVYNGGNDIMGPYRHDPRPGYPFNFLVYEKNPLLESNVASYPAFTLLAYGSNIARYFFPAYFSDKFADFDQLRREAQWGSEEWKSEVAQIYVNNLFKADKISHTFGADFIAFAQPLLYFKDQPAPEEEDLFGNWERKEYCLEVRQKIREEIEKSSINGSLKIVDLSDIYDNTSDWIFTDAIHTTQASKPVVVQAMYQHIMQDFGARFAEVQYRQ